MKEHGEGPGHRGPRRVLLFSLLRRPPDPRDNYTSKYLDVPSTPLHPFGYGLSYTTFAYGDPRLSAARIRSTDSITVSVEVTNTGRVTGDEVVQRYLRDDVASITRPVEELRGFRRITLEPGESRTVTFVLRPSDLTVFVGTSSQSVREAHFDLAD